MSKYKSAADMQIFCGHCNYEFFDTGKALLNTRGMTFFNLDWLNQNATLLICKRCGHIHWFYQPVTEIEG